MSLFHLDSDYLIHALTRSGPERRRLEEIASSDAAVEMSGVAWYEFCRGPRLPEHLAVARSVLTRDGIVPFGEELADLAAAQFRTLGRPRRRAADIAIGVTAAARGAVLLTRNAADFADIDGLTVEPAEEEGPSGPPVRSSPRRRRRG